MNLEELATRERSKRQNEREENRRRFPVAAELLDACERVFGKCRVIRAGNYETGEKAGAVDSEPWLPWPTLPEYRAPFKSVQRHPKVRR